jgi:hypothetical protein
MSKKYTSVPFVRTGFPMLTLVVAIIVGCGGPASDDLDPSANSDLSIKDASANGKNPQSQGRGPVNRGQTAAATTGSVVAVGEAQVVSGGTTASAQTFAAATSSSTVPSTNTAATLDTLTLAAGSSATSNLSPSASARKLLQASDFVLLGRFALPVGGSGMDSTTYSRGSMAMGSEGASPSIFITGAKGGDIAYGGDPDIRVGEVNVPPTLSLGTRLSELPRGTFRQPMTNVLEGKIREVFDPSTPDSQKLEIQIRGLFKQGDDLLINAIMFYDNNSISVAGHFSRPANLSIKGSVAGPVRVAPQVGMRHAPGPMFRVPQALRQAYGWPAIATGVNGLSISNTLSNGPGLILYNPDLIKTATVRSSIPGVVLSDYPYPGKTFAETMGYRFSMADGNPLNQNPWWTPVNHTKGGGVWPETHETVVFAGYRGLGAPYYGDPTKPPSWGVVDPLSITGAPHAYPYQHVLYLFDQKEYIAVHNGTKLPNDVKAYAAIELPDPFAPASPTYSICGSAHDVTTARYYVMKCSPDFSTGEAIVEVYQLPKQ